MSLMRAFTVGKENIKGRLIRMKRRKSGLTSTTDQLLSRGTFKLKKFYGQIDLDGEHINKESKFGIQRMLPYIFDAKSSKLSRTMS